MAMPCLPSQLAQLKAVRVCEQSKGRRAYAYALPYAGINVPLPSGAHFGCWAVLQ